MLVTTLSTFIFFFVYLYKGLIAATLCGCVATFLGISLEFSKKKKISAASAMSAFALFIALIMTLISIKTKNNNFIKMKLTIISLSSSITFLLTKFFFKKNIMKLLLSEKVNMKDRGWTHCFYNTVVFFCFLALANEIIWRNYSEQIWVNFKVFGTIGFGIVFAIIQSKTISKYSHKEANKNEDGKFVNT